MPPIISPIDQDPDLVEGESDDDDTGEPGVAIASRAAAASQPLTDKQLAQIISGQAMRVTRARARHWQQPLRRRFRGMKARGSRSREGRRASPSRGRRGSLRTRHGCDDACCMPWVDETDCMRIHV